MTAPGGSSGAGGEGVPPPPGVGDQPFEQPVSDAPWASPAPGPIAEYPPTLDYPPPGYQPQFPYPYPGGYQPDPAAGYPSSPPSGYPPPGYQPPYGAAQSSAGFGGAFGGGTPYPPPPPTPGPYGTTPGGYPGAYPGTYPGGYYPPSDYGGYGAGYGAMQSGMNTMAIISLVAGLIGIFCCVSSLVGIVCGTIGLNQIKQTREEGYGLAIAGIVISVATVFVYFVIMMYSAGR